MKSIVSPQWVSNQKGGFFDNTTRLTTVVFTDPIQATKYALSKLYTTKQ